MELAHLHCTGAERHLLLFLHQQPLPTLQDVWWIYELFTRLFLYV
jgi:hypothetical protein